MKRTKAEVNAILRGSWTPKGVKMWWDRERYQLDGETPRQVWDAGDRERVYQLAWAGQWADGT